MGIDRSSSDRLLSSSLGLALYHEQLSFIRRGHEVAEQFDTEEMSRNFLRAFDSHIFTSGQLLIFEFHGENLMAVVRGMGTVDANKQPGSGVQRGILMPQTQVNFAKAKDSTVKIKASGKR